jgi:hypothetical protein
MVWRTIRRCRAQMTLPSLNPVKDAWSSVEYRLVFNSCATCRAYGSCFRRRVGVVKGADAALLMTSFRRCLICLSFVVSLLFGRPVRADDAVTPAVEAFPSGTQVPLRLSPAEPHGAPSTSVFVMFEKPRGWEESSAETWKLFDRKGLLVCELPCSTLVPRTSNYVLEGIGTTGASGAILGSLSVPLPEISEFEGFTKFSGFARFPRETDPGVFVWTARLHLGRGSPDGAVVLAIISGVVFVVGAAVAADAAFSSCETDSCDGRGIVAFLGLGVAALGIGGEVAAIALGLYSERTRVDITKEVSSPQPKSYLPRTRLTLSPFGIAGVF